MQMCQESDGLASVKCGLVVPLSMVRGDEYQAKYDTKWQSGFLARVVSITRTICLTVVISTEQHWIRVIRTIRETLPYKAVFRLVFHAAVGATLDQNSGARSETGPSG